MDEKMIVIDSVVLAAAALRRDARHREASKIIAQISAGKLGKCVFTDYILLETLTLIRFSERGGVDASNKAYEVLTSSERLELIRLSDHELKVAGEIFKKYPKLSFADSATVALMQGRGTKELISFDQGFDGVPGIARREI